MLEIIHTRHYEIKLILNQLIQELQNKNKSTLQIVLGSVFV